MFVAAIGLVLAIASGAASAGEPTIVAESAPPKTEGVKAFEERLLAAHNVERSRLGKKPLIWSRKLAEDAALWAKHQADTATFEHSTETEDGENLWMGTKATFSPEEMVGAWIGERSFFKPGLFPDVATSGKWADVGHYTQLIWYNTTEVGCARATNQADDFLVCRYNPPGNWEGENPLGR